MEKFGELTLSFVKKQYYPYLLLLLMFVAISEGFVSLKGLDNIQAAKVMEMYVIFAGILLLTPLFMPEQDKEIWDLERSKGTPMWKVYFPRLLLALLLCFVIISLFIILMERGGGNLDFAILFRGAYCETIFLGAIGFFTSAVTNQVVIGYMSAVVYFAMNIGGGKYLGKFALFQMMQGNYETWKYWLLGAIALLTAGVWFREKKAFFGVKL